MADRVRIKVDENGFGTGYKISSGLSFSMISPPKDGRKQFKRWDTCRGWLNDSLFAYFTGTTHMSWGSKTDPDPNKLRLLIGTGSDDYEDYRSSIYAAKRVVNFYEQLAGFKTLSKVARVDYSGDNATFVWLVTGPGEWMKSIGLVSMVTLLFRFIYKNRDEFDLKKLTTLDEFDAQVKAILGDRLYSVYTGVKDRGHIQLAWPKFRFLMECYDELFRNVDSEVWYPEHYGGVHDYGVVRMASFSYYTDEINTLLENTFKKWQKRA